MAFREKPGRGAADGWVTVPQTCPSDRFENDANRPEANCRSRPFAPGEIPTNLAGRIGAAEMKCTRKFGRINIDLDSMSSVLHRTHVV